MTTGVSLKEVDTGANACSVEYCPVPGFEAYVACSTYVLDASRGGDHRHADSNLDTETCSTPPFDVVDDADAVAATSASRASSTCYDDAEKGGAIVGQTRTGTIAIYKTMSVQPQPADGPISESIERQDLTLEKAGSVVLDGGVLDAKWAEKEVHDHAAALACVTSTGHLCLYMLEHVYTDDRISAELKHLTSSADRDCLLLSLDWSGGDIRHAKIVVSQSDGQLAIWRVDPSGDAFVEQVRAWPGHHLRGGVPTEAWISFFRKGDDASLVVSGAEDALLKGWDLRAGDSRGVLPAFIIKDHGAGVTAGQWHPWQEHTFASGSYDEIVRIWDVRSVRCPVSTFPTGGGVWRLKWHPLPDHGDILLAACMHAGVRVLNVSSSSDVPGIAEGVIAKYTRHASMAYGVDWCRLERSLNASTPVVASCSFYDNLLCLWRTPPLWA